MVTSKDPAAVMAGLDPAIHPLRLKRFFSMDARVISAFTRVFDALLPAHDKPGQWPQSKV
jgi:hypothetical protein